MPGLGARRGPLGHGSLVLGVLCDLPGGLGVWFWGQTLLGVAAPSVEGLWGLLQACRGSHGSVSGQAAAPGAQEAP